MRHAHALAASAAASLTFLSFAAHADNVSDARELAEDGVKLQTDGKYAECAAKFAAAHKLYPEATTVTVRLGECLKNSGRLVEAREAYLDLARTPVAANAPAPFKAALSQGKNELDQFDGLIPMLTIAVDPSPPPSGTQFHVQRANDSGAAAPDEVLDAAWIGTARRMNPGTYTVFATAPGYASKTKRIVLAEGDKKTESLTLSAGETAPAVAGPQTKVAGPSAEPAPYVAPPEIAASTATASNVGLILGFGGGAFVVGGNAGGLFESDSYSGGSGLAHFNAMVRLRKFIVGGLFEYQALPVHGSVVNSAYVGAHVGFLSSPEKKVAFWLDGGLGYQTSDNGGGKGVGGRFQLGPSFPLGRVVRLVLKGFLGFGTEPGAYAYAGVGLDLNFMINLGKRPDAQ